MKMTSKAAQVPYLTVVKGRLWKHHGDGVYNPSDISALRLWLHHPAKAYMDTHPGLRDCLTKLYIIGTLSRFKTIHQLDAPVKRIKQCCCFFLIHPFVCGYKRRYADQILHSRDLHSCQLLPVHVVVKLMDSAVTRRKKRALRFTARGEKIRAVWRSGFVGLSETASPLLCEIKYRGIHV